MFENKEQPIANEIHTVSGKHRESTLIGTQQAHPTGEFVIVA